MTEESSSQAGSEPAEAEGTALTPDADGQYNLKDKFREALERKRGKQAEAAALAANADVAKIRGPERREGPSRRLVHRVARQRGPRVAQRLQ
ncbi:DUF5302 family protein, partial [Streptomyces violaceoruber]|uniref:DUF5302 family protein n=1 Tax=Streptomyces violaceoruber TaxID=1935 RepID=UPI00403C8EE6